MAENKNKKIRKNGKNAAVLFSGGKDSCLALHIAKKKGYKIKYLLSIIPENFDSFMFHKPYLNLLKKQAEMLNMKLIFMEIKGEKDNEILELEELIKKVRKDIDCLVVGGIASNYQGDNIKKICRKLKIKFYAPLWDYNADKIWREIFKNKIKVVITKIACEGIPREFLGKIITEERFEVLKKLSERYKFRLDFEGGEAETAVLGMPEFKKDINIKYRIIEEDKYRSYLEIKEVD